MSMTTPQPGGSGMLGLRDSSDVRKCALISRAVEVGFKNLGFLVLKNVKISKSQNFSFFL